MQFALVTGAFLFYANLWANPVNYFSGNIVQSGYQTAASENGIWGMRMEDTLPTRVLISGLVSPFK